MRPVMDRRAFAVPPLPDGVAPTGDVPVDIRLAHPGLDPAVAADRLHLVMHEVVAAQLLDDDPPEVWRTAQRLTAEGHGHHDILHMLGATMADEIRAALDGDEQLHDPADHVAALEALPEQRTAPVRRRGPPPPPPARRRRAARRRDRRG